MARSKSSELKKQRAERKKPTLPPALLTEAQAANKLGCAQETLKKSRQSGRLYGCPSPPYRKMGIKAIRYEPAIIDAWLSENAISARHTAEVMALRGLSAQKASVQ